MKYVHINEYVKYEHKNERAEYIHQYIHTCTHTRLCVTSFETNSEHFAIVRFDVLAASFWRVHPFQANETGIVIRSRS